MESLLGNLTQHRQSSPASPAMLKPMAHIFRAGLLCSLATAALGAGPSHAFLSFSYSSPLGLTPDGTPPWAKVTIFNSGTNQVTLKLQNLVPAPYGDTINALVFNLTNPLTSLSTTCSTGGTAYVPANQGANCTSPPLATYGTDNQGITGGGQSTQRFDLALNLPPPPSNNPSDAVNGGETMTFVLTGSAGFDESWFNATNPPSVSPPNPGGFYTFAKFQSLANGGSTEVSAGPPTVGPPGPGPEDSVPGPLPLAGAAAAFSYSRKLRYRLKSINRPGIG